MCTRVLVPVHRGMFGRTQGAVSGLDLPKGRLPLIYRTGTAVAAMFNHVAMYLVLRVEILMMMRIISRLNFHPRAKFARIEDAVLMYRRVQKCGRRSCYRYSY